MGKAIGALGLIVLALSASGCGEKKAEFKPALDLAGSSILVEDGREVKLRVWDPHVQCYRIIDPATPAELVSGDPKLGESADDTFLDVNLTNYTEDKRAHNEECE